jgi:signal peptidase II
MAAVLIIDRIIKIAVTQMFLPNETQVIIPGLFHLTYILNPGAAFGLLAGQTWIPILTAILVLLGIIYVQFRYSLESKLIHLSLGMIGGGALGNLLDRILAGKVIDYLDIPLWPFVFNFADSMIVGGGLLLVILLYGQEQRADS